MRYTTVKIDNKEYKCRLTAETCCDLEDALGHNPLDLFIGGMPKLKELLKVFEYSLKCYHKDVDNVYELYDKFIDEGNTMGEFFRVTMQILQDSGFIEAKESKN